jgi:hypothetical protein
MAKPMSAPAVFSSSEVTVRWRDIGIYRASGRSGSEGIKTRNSDRLHYTTFRYLCRPAVPGFAPFR